MLVHGACHGAWCWYKVATLLKSAGHSVTALDMAAAGVHPKQQSELCSMSDYFEPLIEFMKSLPSKEQVILVGHSMGGVCVSHAMERFPEKISCAVFVSCFMPGPDLTLPTATQEYARRLESRMDCQYMFDHGPQSRPTSMIFGPKFISSKLYQLSPPEDLALAIMLMRPVGLYSEETVLRDTAVTKEGYGSVRRIYIICDQDKLIKEDFQKWVIDNNPMDEVKVISGSDHMVMFSKPQELCSCLQEIAGNCS